MDRVAVLAVASMLVLGAAAFIMVSGGPAGSERPSGLQAPTWRIGDVHHYTVDTTQAVITGYETQLPSRSHDLHVHVVDDGKVMFNRTWIDPTGHLQVAWSQAALGAATLSPVDQIHPWLRFPLRPDDAWRTGPLPGFAVNDTTAEVVAVRPELVMGDWEEVWVVEHEETVDGEPVRTDRIEYAPAWGVISKWSTTTWQHGNETIRIDRVQELVDVTFGLPPLPDAAPRDDGRIRIYAKDVDFGSGYGRFSDSYVQMSHQPLLAALQPNWDPWNLIQARQWQVERYGQGTLFEGDSDTLGFFPPGPGAYRLTTQSHGDGWTHNTTSIASVSDRGATDWSCDVGIASDWCSGPTHELPPRWSFHRMELLNPGEVRYLDQDGTVLDEGPRLFLTEIHASDRAVTHITPQFRNLDLTRIGQEQVQVNHETWFSLADW